MSVSACLSYGACHCRAAGTCASKLGCSGVCCLLGGAKQECSSNSECAAKGWGKCCIQGDSSKCCAPLGVCDCCASADDCSSVDCSSQGYPGRVVTCKDNSCKCGSCSTKAECNDGWCCDFEAGGVGQCRQKGETYGIYICDPVEGFVLKEKPAQTKNLLVWLVLLFSFL